MDRVSKVADEFKSGRRKNARPACDYRNGGRFVLAGMDYPVKYKSRPFQPQFISFMYSMISARSFSFFMPANTIFVPGMYFLDSPNTHTCACLTTRFLNFCWHRNKQNPQQYQIVFQKVQTVVDLVL